MSISKSLPLLLALASWPMTAGADWQPDGAAVCTVTGSQGSIAAIPDGEGGAILVWQDRRPGIQYDVYAQRVNASGVPLWTADGVAICTATGNQGLPIAVPDATGGAYLLWEDSRTAATQVYVQHVDRDGTPLLAANGVSLGAGRAPRAIPDGEGGIIMAFVTRITDENVSALRLGPAGLAWTLTVCNATQDQRNHSVAPDGAGGAIVAWEDRRGGVVNADVYAQRLTPSGTVSWTANGVGVCTASSNQLAPETVTDGAGGAIVTWTDERGGATTPDIYAQRVDSSGVSQWTANGVAVMSASGQQNAPQASADGFGGMVVVWQDYRSGTTANVYAQRVSPGGTALWTAAGVAVCTAALNQLRPRVVPDGRGGAIVSWEDDRVGAGLADVYVQGLDSQGAARWTANGEALCTASDYQGQTVIVSDGMRGAIVAWSDQRSGDTDIYAQRIDEDGVAPAPGLGGWTPDGAPVTTTLLTQESPAIASDSEGGAFVVWEDNSGLGPNDIAGPLGGGTFKLRVGRLDENGDPAPGWPAGGIAISSGAGQQLEPAVVPDGLGGVFVTWKDSRSGGFDLYAQHITASGAIAPGWTVLGLALCTATGDQRAQRMTSDQAGGFLVAWEDGRSGDSDIYALRVTGGGAIASGWPLNGLAVGAAQFDQVSPSIASDGMGGALIAWSDLRSGDYDVYVSRLTADGALASGWPANGLAVCTAIDFQTAPSIDSDGVGGALVAWEDRRGGGADIYAQRVTGSGAISTGWTADGVVLCGISGNQTSPTLVGDARGGALVVWEDERFGLNGVDIFATRVTANGTLPGSGWLINGNPVCQASGDQRNPDVIADGVGGFYAAWEDRRGGEDDVYAVRIDAAGARDARFPIDGGRLCRAGGAQTEPAIAGDGAGGAIVCWTDGRIGADDNIHALHLLSRSSGTVTSAPDRGHASLRLLPCRPNPAFGRTIVAFELPAPSVVRVEVLDASGRRVRRLVDASVLGAGPHEAIWDGRNDSGRRAAAGVYWVRVLSGGEARGAKVVLLGG